MYAYVHMCLGGRPGGQGWVHGSWLTNPRSTQTDPQPYTDAAGIVTSENGHLNLRKDNGLVAEVFQQHHMTKLRVRARVCVKDMCSQALPMGQCQPIDPQCLIPTIPHQPPQGSLGIGHVRYPTAGSSSCAEAQPLFTNYPYGICAAHNGNLTNTRELRQELAQSLRHINTGSDSELLLNVFAEELQARRKHDIKPEDVFEAVRGVMARCKGAYGVVVRLGVRRSFFLYGGRGGAFSQLTNTHTLNLHTPPTPRT